MLRGMRVSTCRLVSLLALLSTTGVAEAACALPGTWQFFAMQGDSPAIQSTQTNVRNAAGTGVTSVKVFPSTGEAYQNDTAGVIHCTLTVKASGAFTGACDAFGVAPGTSGPATVSGQLALSACNLTGTITVAGEPPNVVIRAGRINSNSTGGAGIATKGTGKVLHFTLVK